MTVSILMLPSPARLARIHSHFPTLVSAPARRAAPQPTEPTDHVCNDLTSHADTLDQRLSLPFRRLFGALTADGLGCGFRISRQREVDLLPRFPAAQTRARWHITLRILGGTIELDKLSEQSGPRMSQQKSNTEALHSTRESRRLAAIESHLRELFEE